MTVKQTRNPRKGKIRIQNALFRCITGAGMSEQAWCAKHGFDPAHINRVKNGHHEPSGYTMLAIANALDKPVETVFRLAQKGDGGFVHPQF